MADKDINIHIRAPGVEQVRQDVDNTTDSFRKMGSAAEDINRSTDKAFADGMQTIDEKAKLAASSTSKLSSEAGILGSAFNMLKSHIMGAIAAMIAFGSIRLGRSIINAFNEYIAKADELMQKNIAVRESYKDLFEVMNQFSEQGRRGTVAETEKILAETRTPAAVGMPAIEEYTRQFKGRMKPADYQKGIRQVLSYAARHGGEATPDLIQMMRGYGLNTPQQQSEFMRTITAAGGQAGLTDREMIDALGRAAPSARAMEMSPQETISIVSAIASGEIGRAKTAMPATVIDALASPQAEALKKARITGKTPQEIFAAVRQKTAAMSAADRYKFLQSVYGDSAAKGIYKLMTGGVAPVEPVTPAAVAAEERQYRETTEAKEAAFAAQGREAEGRTTPNEEVMSRAARRAKELSDKYKIEHPVKDYFIQWLPLPIMFKNVLEAGPYLKEHPEQAPQSAPKPSPQSAPIPVPLNYGDTMVEWGTNPFGAASQLVQNYYNNTYINQTPPDAQPRSNGGL